MQKSKLFILIALAAILCTSALTPARAADKAEKAKVSAPKCPDSDHVAPKCPDGDHSRHSHKNRAGAAKKDASKVGEGTVRKWRCDECGYWICRCACPDCGKRPCVCGCPDCGKNPCRCACSDCGYNP